jgi:hypothetical protein
MLSQNENNHWQFGSADVDFTSNPPIVNTIPGGDPGLAFISDINGNLLFYTDGVTIWNKNHQIMPNGSNLGDYPESVQRSIIVPHPGNSNQYYVFRHEGTPCNCGTLNYGIYVYSIIDFTNNSLGELLYINPSPQPGEGNNYTIVLKDTDGSWLEHVMSYSPLTFTKSSTGNFYWVIVQDENRMISYKVDQSGINPIPVVSTFSATGQIYNIGYYNVNESQQRGISQSMFRLTPGTNSKLYGLESSKQYGNGSDVLNHGHRFYRLDFNNSTGQFSNFVSIAAYVDYNVANNFELSPDLQTAYFTCYKNPYIASGIHGAIIAKDLNNLSTNPRVLYETVNTATPSSLFGSIQKDKYDNVWVSGSSTTLDRFKYLHKISNPNSYTTSTITVNSLYLNGSGTVMLPQLIPYVGQSCEGNITLTSTETASNIAYRSSGIITTNTNYIVNIGSTISLHAEDAIYLDSNTDIKAGSIFLAEIAECSIMMRPTSSENEVEHSPNSIDEMNVSNFTIYPNPSSTTTTLSLKEGTIKHLTISSLEGTVLFDREVYTTSYDINVETFKKGIYIVTVQTADGKIFTEKLMKND